ncbi:hypothetical protein A176_005648 [Myxococcus hansupus]|uniref:Uncharacterized protein n=1 Tax=Pseudomyxococcus hansupus TaxID=1297742 RepID=A0A0H4WZ63_9BACT|nr:hypothetical protein A176_005648 [Myxococcus hansupus]
MLSWRRQGPPPLRDATLRPRPWGKHAGRARLPFLTYAGVP